MSGESILVIKNDHTGREVWRYEGIVLERGLTHVTLEAFFNREDRDDGYVIWRRGDRFIEHFYSDRWYNIFEVHDVTDDRIKGWYCNLTRPARIRDGTVAADDLSLDVWIDPDGRTLIMDEDEYTALPLTAAEREAVQDALADLLAQAQAGSPPFAAG